MSDYESGYAPIPPNKGKLFKNKDKVAGDDRPDYSGPFTDERGDEARVAAWLRTAKNGSKYMFVQVTEKYVPEQQAAAPTPPPMPDADKFFDDE